MRFRVRGKNVERGANGSACSTNFPASRTDVEYARRDAAHSTDLPALGMLRARRADAARFVTRAADL
jgi:hypothetical protein